MLLEIACNLTGSLVWPRRAAIRRLWNTNNVSTTPAHRSHLLMQSHGFCACFPSLQSCAVLIGLRQTFNSIHVQTNAGRDHCFVIAQCFSGGEFHGLLSRINTDYAILNNLNSMTLTKSVIWRGNFCHSS